MLACHKTFESVSVFCNTFVGSFICQRLLSPSHTWAIKSARSCVQKSKLDEYNYHSMILSCCQNSALFPPISPRARRTGVCAPSSTLLAPLPFVISVVTKPGQQLLTRTPCLFVVSSRAIALVIPMIPVFETAYAALGQPFSDCLPSWTAEVKPSISLVTSPTVLDSVNWVTRLLEYLLPKWPDIEATLTRRPPSRIRGRNVREAARVP